MDFGNCVVLGGDWGLIWSWVVGDESGGGGWRGKKEKE